MTDPAPPADIEVVELVGEFDLGAARSLGEQLTASIDDGRAVIVDLGDCTFVDVAVLRMLWKGYLRARSARKPFVVVLPFAAPAELRLTMLELGSELVSYPVVPDRASAVKSLARSSREQVFESTGTTRPRDLRARIWENGKRRETLLRRRNLLILEQRAALRGRARPPE